MLYIESLSVREFDVNSWSMIGVYRSVDIQRRRLSSDQGIMANACGFSSLNPEDMRPGSSEKNFTKKKRRKKS